MSTAVVLHVHAFGASPARQQRRNRMYTGARRKGQRTKKNGHDVPGRARRAHPLQCHRVRDEQTDAGPRYDEGTDGVTRRTMRHKKTTKRKTTAWGMTASAWDGTRQPGGPHASTLKKVRPTTNPMTNQATHRALQKDKQTNELHMVGAERSRPKLCSTDSASPANADRASWKVRDTAQISCCWLLAGRVHCQLCAPPLHPWADPMERWAPLICAPAPRPLCPAWHPPPAPCSS